MFTRPDNSVYPSGVLSSDIDNAELAARLGNNRLRRDGRVVYQDYFTNRIGWSALSTGAGGEIEVYTYKNIQPLTPPGLIYLKPGNGAGAYASITKIMPDVTTGTMGLEVVFSIDTAMLPDRIDNIVFSLYYDRYRFSIRADVANGELQYLDSANTYQLISSITWENSLWYDIKIVINTDTGKYKFVRLDKDTYTVDYACYAVGWQTTQAIITAYDEQNSSIEIDSVIITTDESLR